MTPRQERSPAGAVAVNGDTIVDARGVVTPFDVHRPTYRAVGGDGFLRWEHGPSLPVLVRADGARTRSG